jgi:hypothetical protein
VPEGTELLTGPNLSQVADGVAIKIEAPAQKSTQAKL